MAGLAKVFLSPNGRLSRLSYWRFGVFYPIGLYAGLFLFDSFVFDLGIENVDEFICIVKGDFSGLGVIDVFDLVLLLPLTVLEIKRFHDLGWSGWWSILWIVLLFLTEYLATTHYAIYQNVNTYEAYLSGYLSISECHLPLMRLFPEIILRSGYYLYPMLLFFPTLIILFAPGNKGANDYGPDPREVR